MMGAGVLINLRYVHADRDRHGNLRIYFWRGTGHRKIRIRHEPDTTEFRAAYDAAVATDTRLVKAVDDRPRIAKPKPNTLRWLCVKYTDSAEFKELDASTRRVRKQIIDHMMQEPIHPGSSDLFADFPLALLTPKAIKVLRDRKQGFPEAGNSRVKALRQVFQWGLCEEDFPSLRSNPAREVKYLKGNREGWHTWAEAEIEQFERRWPIGTKPRLALGLLMFTGTRRSDFVRLGQQMYRKGWLHFTEFKGRNRKPKPREIPVIPELQEILDGTKLGNLTYLVTSFDRPFTANGFGNWFRRRCDEAGLPHCSAHGLRKGGATRAANNGATDRQLMAMYGWETEKEASVYTKRADRRRLAGAAMHLLGAAEAGTNLSHFPSGFDPVRKKQQKAE